ncbi:MAG: hypothetical protein GEU93_17845 [Propionibacteriales bacterium]|nr:hypothetical protein [Propionibacteriales bacterium]
MNEPSFYEHINSMEMRHAYQLIYSMRMITEIAEAYDDAVDNNQDLCARSMLDAFYVHIRLLDDFLVKPTKSPKDFGPFDFGVTWEIPTTDAARRLLDHWEVASKYVVHFGHPRVPDDVGDLEPFEIGSKFFVAMAKNALTVMEPFINAVEELALQENADAETLSVSRMCASTLRDALNEVCIRVGLAPHETKEG